MSNHLASISLIPPLPTLHLPSPDLSAAGLEAPGGLDHVCLESVKPFHCYFKNLSKHRTHCGLRRLQPQWCPCGNPVGPPDWARESYGSRSLTLPAPPGGWTPGPAITYGSWNTTRGEQIFDIKARVGAQFKRWFGRSSFPRSNVQGPGLEEEDELAEGTVEELQTREKVTEKDRMKQNHHHPCRGSM